MKHRTQEEITALILEVIANSSNGITQTIIMYKAYLTFAQLKRFLSSLLERGIIEYQKEDQLYTITEKGIHLLQVYNQLIQLQTSNNNNNNMSIMAVNKYENVEEPTQVINEYKSGQSSYISYESPRANRWKCEKCQRLFTNLKEIKLHKVEYHSY
jgi:predicted transcriptional regulator